MTDSTLAVPANHPDHLSEFCYTLHHFEVIHREAMRLAECWLADPEFGKFANMVMLMGIFADEILADEIKYFPCTAESFGSLMSSVNSRLRSGNPVRFPICFPVINGAPRLCFVHKDDYIHKQLNTNELSRYKENSFELKDRYYLETFNEFVDAALAKFQEDSPDLMKEITELGYDPALKTPTLWAPD